MVLLLSGLHRQNGNQLPVLLGAAEGHGAWDFCEYCVVAANANAGAWMPLGAALAQDDVSGHNGFTAEAFYA